MSADRSRNEQVGPPPRPARKVPLLGAFALLVLLAVGLVTLLPGRPDGQAPLPGNTPLSPASPSPPPENTLPPASAWGEIDSGDGPSLSWRKVSLGGSAPADFWGFHLLFDGERFYGEDQGHQFWVSNDGESWSETGLRVPWSGGLMLSGPIPAAAWQGKLVAVTGNEIFTWDGEANAVHRFSPTFTGENRPDDLRLRVVAGPAGFLVVYFTTTQNQVHALSGYASADGLDWKEVDMSPFASSQPGGIAAFEAGFIYRERPGRLWYSPTGLAWEEMFQASPAGMTAWQGRVLAYPDDAFTGPSASLRPYTLYDLNGKETLPESGLPPLPGTYVGAGGNLSAGPVGIVAAFMFAPGHESPAPCCSEDQITGVVEFSPDGVTWTRRQLPGDLVVVLGLTAGKDRVLLTGIERGESEGQPGDTNLWIGIPEGN